MAAPKITDLSKQLDQQKKPQNLTYSPEVSIPSIIENTPAMPEEDLAAIEGPVPAAQPTNSLESYKALLERSKERQLATDTVANLGQIGTEYLGTVAGYKPSLDLYKNMRERAGMEVGAAEADVTRAEENAAKLERAKELAQRTLTIKREEMAQRASENQKTREANAINALQASRDRQAAIAAQQEAREANLELRERERVSKIRKQLADEGVVDAEFALRNVDSMLSKYQGKDIPGFGRASGFVPDLLAPTEWQLNRQNVESLGSQIRKMKYGSAQSKQESENFLRELGSGKGMDEATLRAGLSKLKQFIETNKKAVLQSDPKAAASYLANEPAASELMGLDNGPAPSVGTKSTWVMKDGKLVKSQ